ncbi:FecR family protein [Pedobacter sp. ok626]|uniref:FecR family protein n=1 Tax=Pedobacter sp. ok626 TaxID=1761882 RepID=UPI00087F74AA|nr:FecR family protein [Pedobacter sp. ok626]SDL75207.1 FecR family protein [Pedobacter sp. ok626]
MQKEEIQILVHKYLNDKATEDELKQLSIWYSTAHIEEIEWMAEVNNEEELLKDAMLQYIKKEASIGILKPVRRLWARIATGIAAAVALIAFSIYFYNDHSISNDYLPIVSQNDIAPGGKSAILKLGNGKIMQLSNTHSGVVIGANKLTYNDGSDIIYGSKNSIPTVQNFASVSTPRGSTYQVTLPDGSKVWLNAESRVTFPTIFTNHVKRQRRVELVGEAYFEVTKDRRNPFIVVSRGQEVMVLGTHFNVSSYPDDISMKTTLLEGAVKVTNLTGNKSEQIVPGQQAIIKHGKIEVIAANIAEATAWKDGYFRFHELEFEALMKKISRWYNVDFIYEGGLDSYRDLAFGGTVSTAKPISEILNIIERTGKVHFEIRGRNIKVSR